MNRGVVVDVIPKGISEEDMNQLIKDWNLSVSGSSLDVSIYTIQKGN